MTTKPVLRVTLEGHRTCEHERPATPADLVDALIAEGGEIETAWRTDQDSIVVYVPGEGRYLVYRLPDDNP